MNNINHATQSNLEELIDHISQAEVLSDIGMYIPHGSILTMRLEKLNARSN